MKMKEYTFRLWQDGIMVAKVHSKDYERGEAEIRHYAMMYEQDGPVRVDMPKRANLPANQ
jgi:hypothetical protein